MIKFEWDENKAARNEAKHGISFEDATRAFYDSYCVESLDETHSDEETRFNLIGLSAYGLLYIVYTVRGEDTVRLISARYADSREERIYEEAREANYE
jgi:uncharacterized protein